MICTFLNTKDPSTLPLRPSYLIKYEDNLGQLKSNMVPTSFSFHLPFLGNNFQERQDGIKLTQIYFQFLPPPLHVLIEHQFRLPQK